ncbi:MAG: hypothetical protein ACR2L2_09850 [Acidobacteriota bacterium]
MLSPKVKTFVILLVSLVVIAPLGPHSGQADLRQRKIAFDSFRSGTQEIYVMDPDGQNQKQLTHTPGKGKGSGYPQWSPGHTKIAFNSNRGGNWELYIMNPDGSNVRRLTRSGKGYLPWSPAWSPDGTKIAFISGPVRGPWRPPADPWSEGHIYVMEADGSNPHLLPHSPGEAADDLDWSRDGRKILFYSDRFGNEEIFVMEADGANVQRLTYTPGKRRSFNPTWSPDGKRIVFCSDRDGNMDVYAMDADGSNVRRLTYTPGKRKGSWGPRQSPDGKGIVFGSDRDGTSGDWRKNKEIYVVEADGSNLQGLTFNKVLDTHPDW